MDGCRNVAEEYHGKQDDATRERVVTPPARPPRNDIVFNRQEEGRARADRIGKCQRAKPERRGHHGHGERGGCEADRNVLIFEERQEDLRHKGEQGLPKVSGREGTHLPRVLQISVRVAAVQRRRAVAMWNGVNTGPSQSDRSQPAVAAPQLLECMQPGRVGHGSELLGDGIQSKQAGVGHDADDHQTLEDPSRRHDGR